MSDDTAVAQLLEHFRINSPQAQDGVQHRNQETWTRDDDPLGSGAFGIIYLERSNRGMKARAVKQVIKQRDLDCRKELLALTRLSRPAYIEHFAEFLGWYEDRTTISFVMEYFELGDLRGHMSEPILESEAQNIAFQLFSGLEVMHGDGFTHRDLKPENIFVAQRSPFWNIKIGDFGVAKRVLNDDTALQTQVGTRNYMAPEVQDLLDVEGDTFTYTNAADIWSSGIVIYEMMCAKKPFSETRMLKQYCRQKLDFPAHALSSQAVSLDAIDLLRRLLKPMPSDRPSAAAARSSTWFKSEIKNSITVSIQGVETASMAKNQFMESNSSSVLRANAAEKKPSPIPMGIKPNTLPLIPIETESNAPSAAATTRIPPSNGQTHMSLKRGNSPAEDVAKSTPSAEADHTQQSRKDVGAADIGITKKENQNRTTPLHMAARGGHMAVFNSLLTMGADITARDENGDQLVHLAARSGNVAMVEHLRELGLDVGAVGFEGRTALQMAASGGHIPMVEYLRKLGQDIAVQDERGGLAIHWAAMQGHIAMVDHLRNLGQDIGARTKIGVTPLHYAAKRGRLDLLDHLCKLGQEITTPDSSGWTPIHFAADSGQLAIVDRLHELDQDLSAKTKFGSTAMHFAARKGHLAVFDRLIELGQDIAVKDNEGWAAIHSAAENGHLDIVDRLHELGQDLAIKTNFGNTPMHLAAEKGHLAMVERLHLLGQDVTVEDEEGFTSIHLDAASGPQVLVEHPSQAERPAGRRRWLKKWRR